MIISLVAAIALQTQGAQGAPKPGQAGQLVGLAIKRFFEAQSAQGTIRTTQQAIDPQAGKAVTVGFETQFAFDRPTRFAIRQTKTMGVAREERTRWFAVTDGRLFRYCLPLNVIGPDSTTELVTQHGVSQSFETMYGAGARGLGERSPILDLAFGRKVDLEEFRSHLRGLKVTGQSQLRGKTVNVVEADYCEIPGEDPTGAAQFSITDEGDILKYIVKNRYGVPNKPGLTVEVVTTWDVDVKIGVKISDSVFAVGG